MPYRTHHHNPSSFTPFNPSSSPPSPPVQGMGFEQGAAAAKTAPFVDGDSFVNEMLDFSNGFVATDEPAPESGPDKKKTEPVCEEQEILLPPPPENLPLPDGDDFGLLFQGEGLESLEWLSNIVDDPLPDYSLAGKFPPPPPENRSEPLPAPPCFATPVQTKARTKRDRAGTRALARPVLSESPASSASSVSSAPPNKKKRKMKPPAAAAAGAGAQTRRCSHCGVTKTPQWRKGPAGPKTLCNACGVRHKSGRMFPEYRPALSPNFSSGQHSNSHRKVMEMRRQKENEAGPTGV